MQDGLVSDALLCPYYGFLRMIAAEIDCAAVAYMSSAPSAEKHGNTEEEMAHASCMPPWN